MTRDAVREGDWLGDYEIRSRLRAGGMATLYLAYRHGAAGISRPVVVKVIHPHLAEDDTVVRMFIDEARISSHIRHSNVVYVESFGEQDGAYYIAMEYVDGCSLDQLVRVCAAEDRKLSPAIAAHLAIEAAAGLHAAHETTGSDGAPLGIVHRDVSPSNVLVTRDGRVKLIDFGIAKAHGRLSATRSGSGLKGKLRYMSPEQAWGQPIDRRADIYSLGVCLWELLTSRQLFRAAHDLAVLEMVRDPVIPPPSALHPEVSPALDAVVLRATARRPEDRHQTAHELRRDLMSAVPGAVGVPPELIGELVLHVAALDRAGPAALDLAKFEDLTGATGAPESSVRSAAGELELRAWPGRGWLIAGAIAVAAIGVIVAIATVERTGAPAPVPVTSTAPATEPASAAAAVPTADHQASASDAGIVALPPIDASAPSLEPAAPAVQPERPAAAAPTRPPSPPPVRRAPVDRDRVKTVETDGAVLADEPVQPAKRPAARPRPTRPTPSNAVEVDGAVLAD